MLQVALGLVGVVDVVVAEDHSAAGEVEAEPSAVVEEVVEPSAADAGLDEVSVADGEEAEEGIELFCRLSSHRSRRLCISA